MRSERCLPYGTRVAGCVAVILTALLGTANVSSRPLAASPLPRILPAVGAIARYRVTRSAQGNTGTKSAVSTITLRRKTSTTMTIAGLYDRPAVLTTVTVGPDGLLKIPDDADAPKDNASLADIVRGLNRLTGLFAGETSVPHDGWSAKLRLPDIAGAPAPIVIPIAVENDSAGSFELHGVGQLALQSQAAAPAPNMFPGPPGMLGRRGGFGGPAAFAGGPLPGTIPGAGMAAAPARQAISLAVSVDGRIRHRSIGKVAIVETRSVTVDAAPYVNVSGWTFEAVK